jgi:hypothetical protein
VNLPAPPLPPTRHAALLSFFEAFGPPQGFDLIDPFLDRGVIACLGDLSNPGCHCVQIHIRRSLAPSPSKNARRTQRVTQWYHRVTDGSIKSGRAIVSGEPRCQVACASFNPLNLDGHIADAVRSKAKPFL